MEYHSYKEKLALTAQMTKKETDGQTPFEILKGEFFDIDVKEFQKQYGYDRLNSNIYGKEYQQKRIFTGILMTVLYLIYAGIYVLQKGNTGKSMGNSRGSGRYFSGRRKIKSG